MPPKPEIEDTFEAELDATRQCRRAREAVGLDKESADRPDGLAEDSPRRLALQGMADLLLERIIQLGGQRNPGVPGGREIGAIIDMDSAESCDLDAVAIRGVLLGEPSGSPYADSIGTRIGEIKFPNSNSEHRQIVCNEGVYGIRVYASTTHTLIWYNLGKGLSTCVEVPMVNFKRKLRADKIAMDPSVHRNHGLPVTIAYAGKLGYIPLLKSIKTATSCHVVLPNGEEINAEKYNKPEILRLLKDLLVGGVGEAPNFARLIEALITGSTDLEATRLFELIKKEMNLAQLNTFEETVFSWLKTTERTLAQSSRFADKPHVEHLRISPDTTSLEPILVVESSKKGAYVVNVNGRPREAVVRLCKREFTDKNTGLIIDEFSIRAGLDGTVYGPENAIAYERFLCVSDGLNPTEIQLIDADGTPQPLDYERRRELNYLLSLLGNKQF